MFYPRRVGRQPQAPGLAFDAGPYADIPEASTILGAAKMTGRTPSGWSLGLLEAVTRRERATVQVDDSTRASVEVEPFTNYFVCRVAKDLRGGAADQGIDVGESATWGGVGLALSRHAEGVGLETITWFRAAAPPADVTWPSLDRRRFAGRAQAQRSSARYWPRPGTGRQRPVPTGTTRHSPPCGHRALPGS
jgi:hypothetical protein